MELPTRRFSIFEFCQRAHELCAQQDPADFIKFVMCGVHEGEQAVVDPYLNALEERHPRYPIQITRDYDSFLGFDKDILVETDMTVSPVSRHADVLTKSIHLMLGIPSPENPNVKHSVPFHRIPNLEIGKWGRNSVRAFFPALWSPNRQSPVLTQVEHASFYNLGLKPSIDYLEERTGLASEWPPTYSDEMFRARTAHGQLAFQTKVLRQESVRRLGHTLRRSFEFHRLLWARGMFFMHQVQGVKAATMYDTGDDDVDWSHSLQAFLDRNSISLERMQPKQWYVDVALEVKSRIGESLQWRADSHGRLVGAALQLTDDQANQVTAPGSSHYSRDTVAHLVAIAGCRVTPGTRTQGPIEARYVNIYTTDKAHTYAKDAGRHAKFTTCEEALKLRAGENSSFCRNLYSLFSNASVDRPSGARLEIRVPLEFAQEALEEFDEGVLLSSLFAFPTVEWWSIRAYRALAINHILTIQAESVPKSRALYGSLILTAGCVWLANALNCRPDDHSSSRNLMRCLFPHTNRAGADRNALAYIRSSVGEAAGNPGREYEEENTLPFHPYGMFFLVDFLLNHDHSPRFDMRGRERLTDGSFQFFFRRDFEDIGLRYFNTGILGQQGVHPSRVGNKAVLTSRFYHEDPGALPDLFDMAARGTVGNPIPIDDGSDLEDEDVAEPEGTLDQMLSSIWRQFIVDLLTKSPNQAGAGNPSYLKLPLARRLSATEEVFKSTDLAKYWVICSWKVALPGDWDRAFAHLWPPKGYVRVGSVQNYKQSGYCGKWSNLLDRLSERDGGLVTKEVRKRMDQLMWWPNAQQDRIWCTRVDRHFNLPGQGVGRKRPAPQLLVRFQPQWTPEAGDPEDGEGEEEE